MRVRVIVEDDEGKVLGEGSVPIDVLPNPAREIVDELRRLIEEQRQNAPDVTTPYIPNIWRSPMNPYPTPQWPCDNTGAPIPPPTMIWCGYSAPNTDEPPTDTAGDCHEA